MMRVASAKPLNKVTMAAGAGAVVAILAWALHQFAGVELPAEVQAALIVLVSFLAAYFTPIADGEIVAESGGIPSQPSPPSA